MLISKSAHKTVVNPVHRSYYDHCPLSIYQGFLIKTVFESLKEKEKVCYSYFVPYKDFFHIKQIFLSTTNSQLVYRAINNFLKKSKKKQYAPY